MPRTQLRRGFTAHAPAVQAPRERACEVPLLHRDKTNGPVVCLQVFQNDCVCLGCRWLLQGRSMCMPVRLMLYVVR
jgi:hypothetical protein